jgi:hypothetical protein
MRVISKLRSVPLTESQTADQLILISANPFHGNLAYAIDNTVDVINTIFLNTETESNESRSFRELVYQNLFEEHANCDVNEYGAFEQVVSSTLLNGYARLETYFVKAWLNDRVNLIECGIDSECSCASIESKEDEIKFLKSSSF